MKPRIGSHLRIAGGALVSAALLFASPAAGQQEHHADESWMPWLGCWELTNGRDDQNEIESIGTRRVCVVPAAQAGTAEITTVVDGDVVHSRVLRADGVERIVSEEGCSGFGRTLLSRDGHRLLESGLLQCAGGVERSISGISLLTTAETWIDVQVIGADDERELLVRRYRRHAEDSRRVLAGTRGEDLELAAATVRRAAAASMSVDAVVEAAAIVDAAALEAALIESDAWFDMNADTLLALADAGVEPTVIDVMVALSFPSYFTFDGDQDSGGNVVYGNFPVWAYGYYSPAFAPFGWSYYGRPYYQGPGVVLISVGTGRFGGRVVNGAGYARVRIREDAPRGGFASALRDGSSRGGGGGRSGGGAVTGSGHRSGGSSGTKTAKPRGQ